jgi:hypothetical protein
MPDEETHPEPPTEPTQANWDGKFRPGFDPRRKATGRIPGTTTKKVQAAREMLQAQAQDLVNKLLGLTEEEVPGADGPEGKCPMCGRGMRRPEDLRLRALVAALDRAGLGIKIEHTGEEGGPIEVHTVRRVIVAPKDDL